MDLLKKQGYRFIGEHSVCKICHYTKQSLRSKGSCYKEKFYGIKSHQCCQVSTAFNICQLNCVFCWRDKIRLKINNVDESKKIIENAITEQRKLLSGFKGCKDVNKDKLKEADNVRHFAISLTGESLNYPKIKELIDLMNKNYTSFVVTNGMMPDVMETIRPTQLYLSISASNENDFNKIDKPLANGSWKRLNGSLDVLKKLKNKTRTCIRLTLVKNLNMNNASDYMDLVNIAKPGFLELKGYSWLGSSRRKLKEENVPSLEDIRKFSKEIEEISNYKMIDEHLDGRVVLMMINDKDRFLK